MATFAEFRSLASTNRLVNFFDSRRKTFHGIALWGLPRVDDGFNGDHRLVVYCWVLNASKNIR